MLDPPIFFYYSKFIQRFSLCSAVVINGSLGKSFEEKVGICTTFEKLPLSPKELENGWDNRGMKETLPKQKIYQLPKIR